MTRSMIALVGLVALIACIVGAFQDWTAFLRSWLTATLTWGALPLGALGVLMTYAMTGGAWGERSQHVWRALVGTLPLFALAMLPLLFGLHELFSWTRPPDELPEVVRRKLLYLDETFFVVRWVIYFIVWLGLAWLLAWRGRFTRRVAAPGLILWVFTLTFFSVDWFMSLEPEFYSDVFGLERICAMASAGLALGIWLLAPQLPPSLRMDIANIWLTLLLSWALMGFSQLIIIWSGNIPDEIIWYVHRAEGGWHWIGRLSFVLFMLLPFMILLSTRAKQSQHWLRVASAICLLGYVLQTQWMVMPAFEGWRTAQSWLDPLAVVALGGGFLWMTGRGLQRQERHHE
ncbi:MAG: hypothetical protein UMU75_09005 [Halomonas sp.]|nr:hypothetical protein [Halomonas sp.]